MLKLGPAKVRSRVAKPKIFPEMVNKSELTAQNWLLPWYKSAKKFWWKAPPNVGFRDLGPHPPPRPFSKPVWNKKHAVLHIYKFYFPKELSCPMLEG